MRARIVICVWLLVLVVPAEAQRIAGWRGDGTGRYPAARPPTHWSTSRNVMWATRLPAWSNSSLIISRGRVVVTAEPSTLIWVNALDGQLLWERTNTYADTLTAGGGTPAGTSAPTVDGRERDDAGARGRE